MWRDIQPSMVTHARNLCSAFDPSKVHTQSSYAVGGSVPCSRAPRIEGGERALYIHSPHQQSLQDRDSNSQPFNYESDSLTIRLRLPLHVRSKVAVSNNKDALMRNSDKKSVRLKVTIMRNNDKKQKLWGLKSQLQEIKLQLCGIKIKKKKYEI